MQTKDNENKFHCWYEDRYKNFISILLCLLSLLYLPVEDSGSDLTFRVRSGSERLLCSALSLLPR